ncbi:MAG: pantetheine-phosphate adenylyltransferase [Bacteroidales bacterium]|jgi:pantetheine-phosphate adenylyltransferase|nr:pantetheine-phosphate adenylyltransferase [Bacteroidales bacterium]
MEKIAVFAGSFSPFTKGHEDIIAKALPLFDKIIIAIGHNYQKKDSFTVEQRLRWISDLYTDEPRVSVRAYTGLTTEFCRQENARYLIRGVRNTLDFIQEENMHDANRELSSEMETILMFASPKWRAVSSTLVRELWSLGADYSPYLSYKLPDYQQ